MKTLHLAKDLRLPLDAVTETFAILGRRGSGKTHTAVVMAEEMLDAGVPIVVLDPLDVWWGLRVSKDGKQAGFPIYVAGGSHEDIPLTPDSGKVLADAVVDRAFPIILSIRHLSKSDQRRFVGEFCERLYDRKADPKHRTALHVFIDEADAFVPQRLLPGGERCFGAVDTLVRRGRSSGLAPTLISQRPQVINKDVLSQTEVLVSHQLTGPQDRKALEAWIVANDTEDQQATFMGSLASLQKGEAWFWSPGLLKIFQRVQVRDRRTFDSSATPKPGMATAAPKAFAKVDLEQLTAEIQSTIVKAKADDPRELRKQIKALEAQVAGKALTAVAVHLKQQKPLLTDADRQLLNTLGEEFREFVDAIAGKADATLGGIAERAKAEIDKTAAAWTDTVEKRRALFLERLQKTRVQAVLDKLDLAGRREEPTSRAPTVPARAHRADLGSRVRQPINNRPVAHPGDDSGGGLGKGERQILIAIAQHDAGVTREQLTILSGYKRSTRDAYLQRLSQKRFVDLDGDRIRATDAGVSALGSDFEVLPTGDALRAHWLQRLPEGERKILAVLARAYPNALARESLSEASDYKRSTRDAYLQRLLARRLVTTEGRGHVRVAEELFS